jgi:hypothetical protein
VGRASSRAGHRQTKRLARTLAPPKKSMMRRLWVVGFDAFQFQSFHRGRLPLDFFLQALKQFVLSGHHIIQLLDLVFEMDDVRFKLLNPLGNFICHGWILPAHDREVEASLALRYA